MFWKEKTGKNIISYGRWLFAAGLIRGIVFIILSVVFCTSITDASIKIGLFLYSVCGALIGAYYVYCGVKIKGKKASPSEISSAAIYIIIIFIVNLVTFSIIAAVVGESNINFGIISLLDLIIVFDSIRYKRKWCSEYEQKYNLVQSEKVSNKKDQSKLDSKPENKEKAKAIFKFIIFLIVFICIAFFLFISNVTFYRTEITYEKIDSEVVYEDSLELELGQQRIKQSGKDGQKEVTYKISEKLFEGEVSREEVDSKVITKAENTIIEKGTKRYRFMWCSDNYYLYYYENDYSNNKNIGYTWSGEDACQKDGHGVRVNVSDSPPPSRYFYYY